jgi:hypothetical protein
MVKSVTRYAALASCAGVVLAACAISPPHRTAGAADARPAPRRYVPARAACPAGRLLPHGGRVELEWVDFLQFGGRQYIAGPGPAATIRPSRLGPVITHIRCSLAASDDHRHIGIPLADGSAAFLPAGAAVFEVRGYSPRCRLASYVSGQPHLYLAQHDLRGQSAPLRCAL